VAQGDEQPKKVIVARLHGVTGNRSAGRIEDLGDRAVAYHRLGRADVGTERYDRTASRSPISVPVEAVQTITPQAK